MLVYHGAVIGDVEELVVAGRMPHLGHQDLHLERLDVVGEHLADDLGVGVGQGPGVDVLAAVRVALDVGVPHPCLAQLVVLVELADASEGDTVVDLADLAQGAGRVLRRQQDPVVVGHADERTPTGDVLAGIVRLVLHELLGGDVERHAHGLCPMALLRSMRLPKRSATSDSSTRSKPAAVMVATVG